MDMMEDEAVCIMSVWMRHTGRHGIGKDMVVYAMKALQDEKINKVS